jgi:hypothetical protein
LVNFQRIVFLPKKRRLKAARGWIQTFPQPFGCQNRPVLGWTICGCVQHSSCSQNTSEKQSQSSQKSQFTIHFTVSQFSSSVCCFVYIGVPKRRKKKVPTTRGVLHHVIIPFLYCDLFKASAQAKKHFQTFSFFVRCVSQQNTGLCFAGWIFKQSD